MQVLVVDDHEIVRRGVRSLLDEAGIEVCGEAVDGSDAIVKAQELKPDVVVMDVSMPNVNGIEATIEIVRHLPETRVVMLSQHDYPHILTQAIHAGASAYVVKSAISTDLVPALMNTRWQGSTSTLYLFGSAQRNVPVQEILQRGAALEAALRDSEERYRLTFQEAAVGIAHVGRNGQWLRVNRKLCEMLGYPEEQLLKLRVQELTYPPDVEADQQQAARLEVGELNQYSIEKRYVRKDGRIVWAKVAVAAIFDARLKLKYFVRVIEEITARKQAEDALRRSEQELARENADLKLLQGISTELVQEGNGSALYEKIVDAAVAIMGSQYASMQLLERGSGELVLLAFRGFNARAAQFWKKVPTHSGSTCAVALKTAKRVIVPDVEECAFVQGTEDLTTYRSTGIRAVQSTPLLSRSGQLVGMISTHWKEVHTPTERDLRMFDVLVRQAADLIERRRAEEALREMEERLRNNVAGRQAKPAEAPNTERPTSTGTV
jgi:PAS domain S-box-containing protein